MPTLAAPLDFAKLEGRNIRVHVLGSAPGAPVTGQMYYDSGVNKLFWYNGSGWVAAEGGSPSGAAGGDLTGSYPNPQILAGAIILTDCNATMSDQAAGTASLRSIGTTGIQACAGNDARLTDGRAPTGTAGGGLGGTYPNPTVNAHAASHNAGGGDALAVDAAAGTGSLRTLGTTGNKAMPGVTTLNAIPGPVADVAMGGNKITVLGTPTIGTDAATKAYADSVAQGLDVKLSCRVASVANISVSSAPTTIDGVTMNVGGGDRVLLKDQTTTTENGIWVHNGNAVAMTRATDADSAAEVTPGMFTFIEEGTVNADSGWVLSSGTWGAAMTFSQFSGAGQITAGLGLTKTGNTLDIAVTANRTVITTDAVDIASNYAGQTSIITLGTVLTGTWNATSIQLAFGGTGATTAPAARTNLGAAGYFSTATHTAGTTIFIPQTGAGSHGLQVTRGLLVQCQIESTGAVILPDISVAANGDVTVTFAVSQSANTIRTTIIG